MPLSSLILGILFLLKDNIWLWSHRIGHLVPKQWNRPSYLNEGGYLRLQVKVVTINVANLLNFDKVGDGAMLVDSSLLVPSTSIPPGSSRNKHKSAAFDLILEVELRDIPINDGHYPLFLDKNPIKIFY